MRIVSKLAWEIVFVVFMLSIIWGWMMFKPNGDLSQMGMEAEVLKLINAQEEAKGTSHRCLSVSLAQKAERQFEGFCETNDAGQWRVTATNNDNKTITANWGP